MSRRKWRANALAEQYLGGLQKRLRFQGECRGGTYHSEISSRVVFAVVERVTHDTIPITCQVGRSQLGRWSPGCSINAARPRSDSQNFCLEERRVLTSGAHT